MLEDAFNAVPAEARCEACKHFAIDPKTGKMWCEWLGRNVKRRGWCADYQGRRPQDYASKLVEKY